MGQGMRGRGWGDHKVENKCDFSCRQKEAMSFVWWSSSGSLFQRMGAALRNDLAPEQFLFHTHTDGHNKHLRSNENNVATPLPTSSWVPSPSHTSRTERSWTSSPATTVCVLWSVTRGPRKWKIYINIYQNNASKENVVLLLPIIFCPSVNLHINYISSCPEGVLLD